MGEQQRSTARATQPAAELGEASLRRLFHDARIGLASATADGRLQSVNPCFAVMLGRPASSLVGHRLTDFVTPQDVAVVEAVLARLTQGHSDTELVEHRLEVDGRSRWVRANVVVMRDHTGQVEQFAAIVEDIDHHRRAERELDTRRTLTRLAGQLAAVGGWSVDATTSAVVWSDELYAILEHAGPEALPLEQGFALFPEGDRALLAAAIERCRHDGEPIDLELEMRTVTGRPIWVRVAGEARRGVDGSIEQVVGMLQDITPLKRANEQAERLARQLTDTLESITDAFFTVDRDWRVVYVNAPGERLLQCSRDELLGEVLWECFPEAVDTEVHRAYLRAVRDQQTVSVDGFYYPPLDTWFEITAYPSDQGLAVYFRDAEERVQRERRLERVIAQEQDAAARLRELDRIKNAFLSAVSHELRTPLTVVQGMGRTLQRLRGELGEQRVAVEDALVEHADRLVLLLEELLDVDRLARGVLTSRRVTCDAAVIVREAALGTPAADRVVFDLPATLSANVDASQLERITVNLVENAGKYAPDGPIEVVVRPLAGAGLRLEVVDQGPGIDPAERERVFEPLYRVDETTPRPGTGVGLALVAAFAQLHGGRAEVLDSDGGAHLVVELPGSGGLDDARHPAAGR